MRLNHHVLSAQAEDFGPIRRAQSDPAMISLAVADPYKRPFPHVLDAYHAAIAGGFTRYGPSEGFRDLREAIAQKLEARNAIRADPDTEVLVCHGAGNGFLLSLMACLEPGDEVLTPDPSFPLNFGATQVLGAVPVSCPIDGPGGVDTLPDRMAEAVTPRTRLMIVHNPNNPTGNILPVRVLERIAEVARAHDLVVLSDEVYERFVYDGHRHVSIATLPGMRERTITLFSFSKDYALSGLRVGYLTGPPLLVSAIFRIQRNDGSGANAPGQRAALAALTGPQDALEAWAAEFDTARRRTVAALNEIPGVACPVPDGGYFVFPDLAAYGDAETLAGALLEEAKVGVAPGIWYGRGGAGHLRLCYAGVPPDRLEEALERIRAFLRRRPRYEPVRVAP
jgi:aspartate aminotransferase